MKVLSKMNLCVGVNLWWIVQFGWLKQFYVLILIIKKKCHGRKRTSYTPQNASKTKTLTNTALAKFWLTPLKQPKFSVFRVSRIWFEVSHSLSVQGDCELPSSCWFASSDTWYAGQLWISKKPSHGFDRSNSTVFDVRWWQFRSSGLLDMFKRGFSEIRDEQMLIGVLPWPWNRIFRPLLSPK